MQSQLTATRSHLTALQKKEITIESQQQLEAQKQLLTDIEALKLQLTSCELVNDERKKDHVSVRLSVVHRDSLQYRTDKF